MKIDELFSGAWVKKSGASRPETVYSGDLKNIFMDIENFGLDRKKELEEIYEPVSLSPEILKKSGFNDWGSYFWDDKAEIRISRSCLDDGVWVCEYDKSKLCLHYVHELQYFFKVCGINISILV